MKRYLEPYLLNDLKKKMVFVTGPRQVGKTFLTRSLMPGFQNPMYLNYDDIEHASVIRKRLWPQNSDIVILDELHKMKKWKSFIKGTFDTRPEKQNYLITGSARLETFRQTGDSMAGRYYHYRLCPLSVKELSSDLKPYEAVSALNTLGGFPEPFFSGSLQEARRWRRQYYTDLVREDILDFSRIQEVRTIRILLEMLRKRVGSPLSYTSLANDLQIAPNTVKKYISILESLYIIFLLRPYHHNIARSLLKEPKVYFYDTGSLESGEGEKLENTVAVCLLKHVHFLQDTQGMDIDLHYLKTKDKKEIDFVMTLDGKIHQCIEVKLSDDTPAASLKHFLSYFPDKPQFIQLVHNLRVKKDMDNISLRSAGEWLSQLAA